MARGCRDAKRHMQTRDNRLSDLLATRESARRQLIFVTSLSKRHLKVEAATKSDAAEAELLRCRRAQRGGND